MYRAYQYDAEQKTRDVLISVTDADAEASPPGKWKVRHFKNTTVAPNTTIMTLRYAPEPAVLYAGVTLYPGDSCTASIDARYTPYRGSIHVIGSDANVQLSVHEE